MALDNGEQLDEEAWHAVQDIHICDGMQCFNPFDQHDLTFLVDARLQFLAYCVNQLVQVELQSLVERPVDYIL